MKQVHKDEETKKQVSLMITKVPLGSTIYDYTFLQMFAEDNPETMFTLKMKCSMTFGAQVLVTYFFFMLIAQNFNDLIHYGGWSLNIVRTVMALLLHLQQLPEMERAVAMMKFLVANPSSFASGSLIFPSLICLFRITIALMIQLGGMVNFLYLEDELLVIKFAAVLAIIGAVDGNMTPILNVDVGAAVAAKPLQYIRTTSLSRSLEFAKGYVVDYFDGKVRTDPANVFILMFMSFLTWLVSLLYVCFYYYLMPFIPFACVMLTSYYKRHSPVQPTA